MDDNEKETIKMCIDIFYVFKGWVSSINDISGMENHFKKRVLTSVLSLRSFNHEVYPPSEDLSDVGVVYPPSAR
jgi:hypothetical protein